MTRILVVGINYAPESIGTGKYTSEMCAWLASRGHSVRVITAPPYYPAWRVGSGYRGFRYKRELLDGVEVLRCPLWVPAKPRGLTRLLHLVSFAASTVLAVPRELLQRPQIVIGVAPTLFMVPMVLLASRLSGAKSWLHIQDFELDAAMEMGIVKAGAFKALALRVESWLMRRFDVVSTISRRMLERLDSKCVESSKRVFLPNWVDVETISPLEAPSCYRAELDIPADAVVALYSGNMGLKQGLEILGATARSLASNSNLYFVFGGDGPGRASLEHACAGLANVRFVDLQPPERMRDWLGLADIHLLPQRADVADLVMPSKLTGMLASGRPILTTAHPGTGVAEAVARCGLATPPGDAIAFAAALDRLSGNRVLRIEMGSAAREGALALSRDTVLAELDGHMVSLANPMVGSTQLSMTAEIEKQDSV